MAQPASITWFARHELGLAWRDWAAMMTGGRRTRGMVLGAILIVAALIMHLIAYGIVSSWLATGIGPDKPTLVMLTGGGLLFWSVMLSQALESVTRVYYARADLDLILSSPASAKRLFAVRTGAVALTTFAMACLLTSPLIDVLVLLDGPRWLAAFGVLGAISALSAAIAVAVTIALFHTVGAKRTRLIAQIIAAIVGAGFIIGIQAAAIIYYGKFSRFTLLQSSDVIKVTPDLTSFVWLPARAAMGDLSALLPVALLGFGALAAVIAVTASSYGHHAISTASVSHIRTERRPATRAFKSGSPKHVLRLKEWKLLQRDPWLLSQTLMQILYLAPPALMLWINYGEHSGAYVVVVPVLVMAAGQLAGGLAWLAISGEDAHDLVVTAPVSARMILTAKIEAVLTIIAIILLPLIALLALSSPQIALVTAVCALLSAGSATAIQLWFRVVARRAMFRRRQVASRAATLSEAFASIMWAGTGALWASSSWLALAPAILAILVLGFAKLISPRRD
ncbi:permease [Devosia rhodophyticola]|uniref:Permease n=1 Tax=Devosia rhodophyticola TaxID=3026423 RepID=A0ABY7YVS5_9HYPH|nr:permease [Devosia rhodophyticola]WDR05155.1 permease [Devosia rhodophyticola]